MADIKKELEDIKNAVYGKDVRESIHDGIDAINKEVENTTDRQVDLENTFDQLVINAGNSNAEIVDARVKNDGTSYSKLGDRLDGIDSQLAHNTENIESVTSYIENELESSTGHLTLGVHEDGLLYLFKNGTPQGVGIKMLAQEGDVVGYVDENNNIVLSGELSDAVYTIKYELEDGTLINIGTLNLGYVNQIPLSINSDGSLYNNGKGWKTGYRLSTSSGNESALDGHECTGFIKVNSTTSVIRIKNIGVNTDTNAGNWAVVGYDKNFTKLSTGNGVSMGSLISSTDSNGITTFKPLHTFTHFNSSDLVYVRLCSDNIDETSILTVDQEIE